MPRKQWSKLRSAAVAAAHFPSAYVSHSKSELTQETGSSTNLLRELAVSKRNSRNENTKEKKSFSQPQQKEHKSQEEANQICSEDASFTHKRSRVETSSSLSDCTQGNTVTRSSMKITLVESMQLRTPVKMKRHETDTRSAGSDSSPAIDVSTADDGPNEVDNVSRTEAELLQQHGPLTQLNNLYLTHGESSHDSSITTVEDQTERKEVEEMEDRLQRRREELLQISPGNLALYTRLAECGIDAIDRPFVTCAVKRAQIVVAEWASSFI
ncbi:hypothetical protein LSM04_000596 [Trypanosoma melophagium]|uniref:uncharacterized protein n=1 Tax=Trypanosoma melophagium TaxID=715481 RepID=UPI00351A9F95|nr:hypothetical protein LSM04_000596 [Trypanosoma melophagium]